MNESFERMVIELEDAKAQMIEAKRRIRSETEREAKRVAALKAADRIEQVEVEFAGKLADAHAAGVPQAVLRSQVLRTNDWGTWTKWRDMAGIQRERGAGRK